MNRFATTHWTVVLDAAQFDSTKSAEALADLCKNYWYPLYVFSRSLGDPHSDAQDLTQAFFQHLIEKRLIAGVHPKHGRFRSFLLACFKNFRSVQYRKQTTRKRGGDWIMTSYQALTASERFANQPLDPATPEVQYDRNWAMTVLDRAHTQLKLEYGAAEKERLFERLHGFLQGPNQSSSYDVLAAELNKTKDAVKMEVSRMRRRYGQLLREVVNETVGDACDVEDELRYLLRLLTR